MVASDDEQSCIARCLLGDHSAFEPLVKNYQRMIDSVCFRMTGSLEEAEDLSQATFVRAYRNLSQFRGEAKFSSWLYQIAVRLCINWQQSNRRRERLTKSFHEHASTEEHESDGQLGEEAQQALMTLHPKQRAAIVLTVFEGLNHAQAAQALGCSETTVSWRLFAARKKLKHALRQLKISP